jgi:hypothetical protein
VEVKVAPEPTAMAPAATRVARGRRIFLVFMVWPFGWWTLWGPRWGECVAGSAPRLVTPTLWSRDPRDLPTSSS